MYPPERRWWHLPADYTAFALEVLARLRWLPADRWAVVDQLERLGTRAVGLVLLTGGSTGAIIAWQGAYQVEGLAPIALLCGQVVKVLCMEIGPVLTGLVLAGRIGAALAAELGSMRITEQIDALRSMAIDPLRYLVLPRVVAGMLALPLLTWIATLAGTLGAWSVLVMGLGVSPARFAASVRQFVTPSDVGLGLGKALVFGFLVASLGCWQGLRASGGALGVSRVTIAAFVWASIAVLLADLLGWLLLWN